MYINYWLASKEFASDWEVSSVSFFSSNLKLLVLFFDKKNQMKLKSDKIGLYVHINQYTETESSQKWER